MDSARPRISRRILAAASAGTLTGLAVPATVGAHALQGSVTTPLPFVAYVAGAAVAVGVSFLLIALGDAGPPTDDGVGRIRRVPRALRLGLRGAGLLAWLWIVAQTLSGGSSDADVASLFLWVMGWIGLAMVSALLGPAWHWIDPFTTLHDLGAGVLRRLGVRGVAPAAWPERLGTWLAVVGFAFFVWLELVARILDGPLLGWVLMGYTLVTLVGMAQYGRDAWRTQGETFSVWFGVLGRLAPFALVEGGADGEVRRRPAVSGLVRGPWTTPLVVLVALGTGSIIWDGISQTELFFDLFGLPAPPEATLLLGAFLGGLVAVVLAVARVSGLGPMGAGLVPVALGYLVAHYLQTLIIDGQRILVAFSDPFHQGWDLFGTAFFEPDTGWLSNEVMWTIQVGAVVIGHVVGAWAGHAAARRDAPDGNGGTRRPQVALAALMVALTALTLWSLGQNLVFEAESAGASAASLGATAVMR